MECRDFFEEWLDSSGRAAAGGEPPHDLRGPFDVVVCQLVVSIVGGPADRGRLLYATHHFSESEFQDAPAAAGLTQIAIAAVVEASSRRPQERAIFLYASASKPLV